ncbi:hypothetical protein AVEN_247508-1 [Araneus ventricosus]|uniref:Uncharacterized protein n=1 Tax=Araneus ventricosus TaxID=182803 RepID=A0A4Y2WF89_ARAVE|nr:hypothetical protein AVEN_247508-1 [Araneus ventricosus]
MSASFAHCELSVIFIFRSYPLNKLRISYVTVIYDTVAPLKQGSFGRKPHELDSSNLGGHLPPHLLLLASLKTHGNGLRFAKIIGHHLPRLSPKQSQNLTSPQKKPTASDRPSSLLKGNF